MSVVPVLPAAPTHLFDTDGAGTFGPILQMKSCRSEKGRDLPKVKELVSGRAKTQVFSPLLRWTMYWPASHWTQSGAHPEGRETRHGIVLSDQVPAYMAPRECLGGGAGAGTE